VKGAGSCWPWTWFPSMPLPLASCPHRGRSGGWLAVQAQRLVNLRSGGFSS
jgi:hypothetical protein